MPRRVELREVTKEEEVELRKLAESQTMPYNVVRRARLILSMVDNPNLSAAKACRKVGYKDSAVGGKWVKRFNEQGIDRLISIPGSSHRHDNQVRKKMIALALQKPNTLGYPYKRWSMNKFLEVLKERDGIEMSIFTVRKYMDEAGYPLIQQENWLRRPEFRTHLKLREVTQDEANELRKLAESTMDGIYTVMRARLIVSMLEDPNLSVVDASKIAGYAGPSQGVLWVQRFNKGGVKVLKKNPKPGSSPKHGYTVRRKLIRLAKQEPDELGYPFGFWTKGRLQKAFEEREGIYVSTFQIETIFRDESLDWRKQDSWLPISKQREETIRRQVRLRPLKFEEVEELKRMANSNEEISHLGMCAHLILLMSENPYMPATEASKHVGCDHNTALKWVRILNKGSVEDLKYTRRGGRLPRPKNELVEKLIRLAVQNPETLGYPTMVWSQNWLAKALEERAGVRISRDTVRRWLNEEGFDWDDKEKWHLKAEKTVIEDDEE